MDSLDPPFALKNTSSIDQPPPYNLYQVNSTHDSERLPARQPLLNVHEQPVQTVIISPILLRFDSIPIQIQCPACQAQIVTRTEYKNGMLTWLACGGLCLFGCCLGCQFIPFCINKMRDIEHRCPNCNILLGTYQRI